MPLVSVIVPIYKVEKYIERCARSLFRQTLDDIEYIFVDDCTPDCSIKVLERVMEEYPERIKQSRIVHHLENRGLPSARNSGLALAKGEYIIHCDSDDWVEPEMYEKMYNKAKEEDADIVICNFYKEYSDKQVYSKQKIITHPEECLKAGLKGDIPCYVWNKLIRRELYDKNHISFLDGVNMWEDIIAFVQYFYYCRKVSYVLFPFYHYVQYNSGSIIHQPNKKSIEEKLIVCKTIESFLQARNIFQKYWLEWAHTVLYAKRDLILSAGLQDFERWQTLWPEIHPFIWQMKMRKDLKLIFWLISKRQYKLLQRLLHLRFKLKDTRNSPYKYLI